METLWAILEIMPEKAPLLPPLPGDEKGVPALSLFTVLRMEKKGGINIVIGEEDSQNVTFTKPKLQLSLVSLYDLPDKLGEAPS